MHGPVNCLTKRLFAIQIYLVMYWCILYKFLYFKVMAVIVLDAGHSGRAVFARSNTGIVGSNPARGMDACLRLFCVCVVPRR
jgi:hypothetical protein